MADEKGIVGRPPVMTPEVVQKLVDVLRLGVKDNAACAFAGIGRTTFYNWYNNDEDFRNKIDSARNFAVIAARQVVVKKIVDDKDVETAKWYLDRHDTRQDVGIQQNTQVNIFQALKDKYTISDKSSELPDVVEVKTDDKT